jgi:starch phosphorylase
MESESLNHMSREDREDAESLYRVLETKVVPCYYGEQDEQGIPVAWVKMMRHSIETLAPAFNSDRMVQDYAREIYARDSRGT